jgi:D-alanine-D-alanine ligase
VVFLALHGTYGEDGTVQAELDKIGVPYTGCSAEASRIGFDKALTKEKCVRIKFRRRVRSFETAKTPWPMGWNPPLVIKPVRQGSSVGLQFVERVEEWPAALTEALRHDSQVLIEEKIIGRETTVGILDDQPLPVVEVRPKSGVYDYRTKYSVGATEYFCPAPFDDGDDEAHPGGGLGGVQGDRRTRLLARGCDGATER